MIEINCPICHKNIVLDWNKRCLGCDKDHLPKVHEFDYRDYCCGGLWSKQGSRIWIEKRNERIYIDLKDESINRPSIQLSL